MKVIRIFAELYTIDNTNRIASAEISYQIDFCLTLHSKSNR